MIDLLNDALRNCFGHTLVSCGFTIDNPLSRVQYGYGASHSSYVAAGRQTTSIKVSIKLTFNELKVLGGSDKVFQTFSDVGGLSTMDTNMDPSNGIYFYNFTFVVGDIADFANNLEKLKLSQKIYDATFHDVLEQELKR